MTSTTSNVSEPQVVTGTATYIGCSGRRPYRPSLGRAKRPRPDWVPTASGDFPWLDARMKLDDVHGIVTPIISSGLFLGHLGRFKREKHRSNKEALLARVTSTVLANALYGYLKGRPVAYSRSKRRNRTNCYLEDLLGSALPDSRVVALVVDLLALEGYLDNYKAPQNESLTEVSMVRATSKLIRAFRKAMPADISGLLRYDLTAIRFVELKDYAPRTGLLAFGETSETRELERLGRLWASVNSTYRTTCPPKQQDSVLGLEWFRRAAFKFKGDWYYLGRFFHCLSEWPLQTRRRLEVDGHPTVEFDYMALHVNLLYAHFTKSLYVGDPYVVPTYPYNLDTTMGRALGKLVCNVGAINCASVLQAVRAVNAALTGRRGHSGRFQRTRYPELAEWLKGNRVSINANVIREFVKHHGPVADYLFQGNGLVLQRMDSRILQTVLARFVERGLWVVPFHDSFRVQVQHQGFLIDTMREAFRTETGTELPASYVTKR